MTVPALWLARRELAARAPRVALAAAVVAAMAAAVTATELAARGREAAVAEQLDAIGPSLTVVPRGTTAGALARYELEGALPPGTEAAVRGALGSRLRGIERRVVVRREVAGALRPVVGIEAGGAGGPGASAGSELARLLGGASRVTVAGRELEVARIRPSTAGVDDLALFVPAEVARGLGAPDGASELRVFLAAGVSPRDAEARLARAAPGAAVIRADRGEFADGGIQSSLARHRGAAYAVMAAVAALALLVAAHLDASERRAELAALVAIGASWRTVAGGLVARSAAVALAGAAAGVPAGAAIAGALGGGLALGSPGAWVLGVAVVGAGVLLGAVSGAPTAVAAVARDPVRALQET